MKKTFIAILSLFMLVSCGNSKKENKKTEKVQEVESVVEEESLVRNLDYKTFVKKVWDIETYPDSFAYKSKLPCMIDFYADWCGPCKALSPVIDEIALPLTNSPVVIILLSCIENTPRSPHVPIGFP